MVNREPIKQYPKDLLLRFRFLPGVGSYVIPNSLARKLPPLGCFERFVMKDFHARDVM